MAQFTMRPSSALMKKQRVLFVVSLVVPMLLASCQYRLHEIPAPDEPEKVPVKISVKSIEQIPFGSFATKASVQETCTKLSYAVYSDLGDDSKEEFSVTQNSTDSVFGVISLNLSLGRHYIAVVGQNGGDGNPKFKNQAPNSTYDSYSIRYSSNNTATPKVLDTFHYYAVIDVVRGENEFQINLSRSVAMFRLKLTETIPSQVKQLVCTYNNCSYTLDVINGCGCISNVKPEVFDVDSSMDTFDIYTFPMKGKSKMNMKVTALDEYNNTLAEMDWKDVPIQANMITQYTGDLFQNGCKEYSQAEFPITVNNEWSGTDNHQF